MFFQLRLLYRHCAPLERRNLTDHVAIDISLLWSETSPSGAVLGFAVALPNLRVLKVDAPLL